MSNFIKSLGCGIGFRKEISDDILKNSESIDCVEIITDNYFSAFASEKLNLITDKFNVIPHGVNLSISSPTIDLIYLKNVKKVCDIINAPYYSEHLCWSKVPGIASGHLLPISMNEETLQLTIKNVLLVQDYLQRTLVLENIAYSLVMPDDFMTIEEFLYHLTAETKCGILLDVANLNANSHNYKFDPYKFIDNLPLEYITQIHIAGGYYDKFGSLVDSHSTKVQNKTWDLLRYVAKKTRFKSVILEHDSNFPEDFNELLNQVKFAKTIVDDYIYEESKIR